MKQILNRILNIGKSNYNNYSKTETYTAEKIINSDEEELAKLIGSLKPVRPKIPYYYTELGIDPDASPQEIRAAYTSLLKKYHPDKFLNQDSKEANLAKEKTMIVIKAYNELKAKGRV